MRNNIRIISAVFVLFVLSYLFGVEFIIAPILSCLYIFLKFAERFYPQKKYNTLNISLLFVINFCVVLLILNNNISGLYIPFSLMPMLVTMLFGDLLLSLVFTCGLSAAVMSLSGHDFTLGMITLISGIASSLLVFRARRRSVIIRAGLFVGLIQGLCLFILTYAGGVYFQPYLIIFLNGLFSGAIALFLLLPFEYLFKVFTDISLLELSDTRDNPLLRKMILQAPGTYHHSLLVGNLSEAAAEAISANALLARVGSYYHDIGKIEKAEYFIENQMSVVSSHDILAPSMSKLVVMNHVKEGLELAKKYKLNSAIIDFISQHHGTSLVYYFYRRALEKLEEDQEVVEEGFRYSGPKPKTKETAIVLLADSVEAASRSLKEPDHNKIEELVHKIINNKFIDGQLDECDLTLKDLEVIADVFIMLLGSIYHTRVTYPEETGEDRDKKPAKENSRPAAKDKKSHS